MEEIRDERVGARGAQKDCPTAQSAHIEHHVEKQAERDEADAPSAFVDSRTEDFARHTAERLKQWATG